MSDLDDFNELGSDLSNKLINSKVIDDDHNSRAPSEGDTDFDELDRSTWENRSCVDDNISEKVNDNDLNELKGINGVLSYLN